MYVLRTCAHEHDGQPNLPYGQPYFKVVGHLASCPEKLFLTLVLCSVHIWILLCYVLCTSGYFCVMFCARLDTFALCSVHVWILLCYVLCTSGYFCVMFCARLDTLVLCSVHVWILLCYVLCTSGYFCVMFCARLNTFVLCSVHVWIRLKLSCLWFEALARGSRD